MTQNVQATAINPTIWAWLHISLSHPSQSACRHFLNPCADCQRHKCLWQGALLVSASSAVGRSAALTVPCTAVGLLGNPLCSMPAYQLFYQSEQCGHWEISGNWVGWLFWWWCMLFCTLIQDDHCLMLPVLGLKPKPPHLSSLAYSQVYKATFVSEQSHNVFPLFFLLACFLKWHWHNQIYNQIDQILF